MLSISNMTRAALLILSATGFSGCGQKAAAPAPGAEEHAHDHEEHGHDEEGPHGGHIIELGHDEYHAELTHDEEANLVGVYFLAGDAKTSKPISAESVIINVSADREPTTYTLAASPLEGETADQPSYFELVSEPLNTVVSGKSEAAKATARLNVTIDGKPYVGLIETEAHDHDHDHGHDH
jgi:hypothetical protein